MTAALLFFWPMMAAASDRASTLIADENRRPGARLAVNVARAADNDGFRSPWIEGYCSRQSVRAGESIDIMVSTNPPRPFRIEIFRMGYYGGRGAPVMSSLGPSRARPSRSRSRAPKICTSAGGSLPPT